jgi:hypothetical protein
VPAKAPRPAHSTGFSSAAANRLAGHRLAADSLHFQGSAQVNTAGGLRWAGSHTARISFVMPGLDPGIHDETQRTMALHHIKSHPMNRVMDCRVKPGNDEREAAGDTVAETIAE